VERFTALCQCRYIDSSTRCNANVTPRSGDTRWTVLRNVSATAVFNKSADRSPEFLLRRLTINVETGFRKSSVFRGRSTVCDCAVDLLSTPNSNRCALERVRAKENAFGRFRIPQRTVFFG
jgi:hypothetical protein